VIPEPATPISGTGRIWKVGTLTYTFGGLVALFSWLLWGDFAWSVRDRALQGVVQLLFQRFGASDMLGGLLYASLPAALGMIIGPVVGYKSDRLRTRWGRRIPFLVITTPFMVLALVGLAFSPQLGGYLHHLLGTHSPETASCVLIFLGLFWLIFTIALTTANSVFGALINDVVPQEVLGRFFGLFRAVSLIVGMVFFFWWMGDVEKHFSRIFLGVAVVFGVGFTLMCLKVKEGDYPPSPEDSEARKSAFSAVKTYFRDGFGNPYYLWFFAAGILGNLALGPFNLYCIFYAKSVSMSLSDYGKCLALTYLISFILSYPLGCLVDRFHPLRMTFVVVGFYAVAMAFSYLFVHDTMTFAIALVIHGVIAGTFNTTSASLNQRLLPSSKFAEIGSAGGILSSMAGMLLAPVVGSFLDYKGHDYHYTFLAGFILAAMALVAFAVLHRQFMALGGPKLYIAPE